MGNCLMRNKIVAENEESCEEINKDTEKVTASKLEGSSAIVAADQVEGEKNQTKKKKKVVRFKLNEEKESDSGNGVVRIRLVVTQKELKQILSYRKDLKNPSMEELMRVKKSRGIMVSEDIGEAWRPDLEGIPEEH